MMRNEQTMWAHERRLNSVFNYIFTMSWTAIYGFHEIHISLIMYLYFSIEKLFCECLT